LTGVVGKKQEKVARKKIKITRVKEKANEKSAIERAKKCKIQYCVSLYNYDYLSYFFIPWRLCLKPFPSDLARVFIEPNLYISSKLIVF